MKQWPELWFDMPMAAFDVETTGRDSLTDRITEVGIVHFYQGEVTDRFDWLINPEMTIPEDVVELTGIHQEDVDSQPTFEELAEEILSKLENRGLIAYNLPFDRSFLTESFKRANLAWPSENPTFDPLIMANHFWGLKGNKLIQVCERLNISLIGAHRAFNDAEAVGKVLYALRDKLPPGLEDLQQVQKLWHQQNEEERDRKWGKRRDFQSLNEDTSEISGNTKTYGLGAPFIYGTEPDPLRALYSSLQDVRK